MVMRNPKIVLVISQAPIVGSLGVSGLSARKSQRQTSLRSLASTGFIHEAAGWEIGHVKRMLPADEPEPLGIGFVANR